MSEYQYYEFRAIDRPLDQNARTKLRAISSRAEITATGLTNTYHFGDFKGDPADLMDRYFDAFVYVANWGTRQLMFRIPRRSLDVDAASEYCGGESLALRVGKDHVVLDFSSEDEPDDDWTEGESWMPALISVRDELIRGDYRALYLGWLASALASGWDDAEEDEELREPPVPPGLADLSGSLRSLAEFLRVDDELIQVAAAGSQGEPPAEPSGDDLARWVAGLPAADKDAYLLRFVAEEGDIPLRAELSRRFREATAPRGAPTSSDAGRRTIRELIEGRDVLLKEKNRKAAERAAKDRARLDRERAEARARHLDDLSRREPAAWSEVEQLIARKQPKEYDRAVTLLVDLRDLAGRSDRLAEAEARIQEIRRRHASKPSLIERLNKSKLGR